MKNCKRQILTLQHQLDITIFFPYFRSIQVRNFLTWVLVHGKAGLDMIKDKKYPLDAALELPSGNEAENTEKAKLLSLLIERGAKITNCTFPRRNKTTFLCIATEIAIQESKFYEFYLCKNRTRNISYGDT